MSGISYYLCFDFLNEWSELKRAEGIMLYIMSTIIFLFFLIVNFSLRNIFQASNSMIIKQVIIVLISILSRNQDIRIYLNHSSFMA